jgi:hypothetical protein
MCPPPWPAPSRPPVGALTFDSMAVEGLLLRLAAISPVLLPPPVLGCLLSEFRVQVSFKSQVRDCVALFLPVMFADWGEREFL